MVDAASRGVPSRQKTSTSDGINQSRNKFQTNLFTRVPKYMIRFEQDPCHPAPAQRNEQLTTGFQQAFAFPCENRKIFAVLVRHMSPNRIL